ncbi:MAG TPA: RHS repeat-associated core domain-containing protein, partial [Puia sp.]
MQGRLVTSFYNYYFGFNGKEKDDEAKGSNNQIDYGSRIYDPRVGRFLSLDPLKEKFSWYSPYQYAGNKPIWAIDLGGLEEVTLSDVWNNKANIIDWLSSKWEMNGGAKGITYNTASEFSHNINPVGIVWYNGYTLVTGKD